MADGPSAFPLIDPLTGDVLAHGMALRDWFAGQALQWAGADMWVSSEPEIVADRCYRMADALLAARENSNG